jgi:hypothetical protein
VKVFISYSRIEASETAKTLHNYLSEYRHHEVFIDTSDIHGGDEWWNTIQNAISECDIFVIIVTRSALERKYIKEEIELAKKLKKRIIPCISKRYIRNVVLPVDLNKYQGIEYENLDQLIQEMGHMFESLEKYQSKKSNLTFIAKQNLELPTKNGKNSAIDSPPKEQSVSYPTGKNTNESFLKGFKPKIIIISIIAVAIIGLIAGISYFNGLNSSDENKQIGGTLTADTTGKVTSTPPPPLPDGTQITSMNGSEIRVNEDAKNTIINLDSHFRGQENQTGFVYTISNNSNPSLVQGFINATNLILSYLPHQSGLADISVSATDSTSQSVVSTFKVRVLPINDKPIVSILQPKNNSVFNENEEIFFSAESSDFDLEDDDIARSIKWTSNIDGEIGEGSSFSHSLSVGNHLIITSTKDKAGVIADSKIIVKVNPLDRPPVIQSISITPQTPQSNNNVSLLAKVTDEGNNTNTDLKYQWQQISGPQIDIINSNTNNPSFIAPEVTKISPVEIILIVNDKANNSDSTTTSIEIHP